jgi:hypothetical protein
VGACLSFDFIELENSNNDPIGSIVFGEDEDLPISDEAGSATTGYTFKLENKCRNAVNYQVVLESLKIAGKTDNDYFADNMIKVQFDNGAIKTYDDYDHVDKDTSATYAGDIRETKELLVGTIPGKSEDENDTSNIVTHNLKMWISSESTNDDIEKVFRSKIKVFAGQGIESGATTPDSGNNVNAEDVEYINTYFLGAVDPETGERPKNINVTTLLVPADNAIGYAFEDGEISLDSVVTNYINPNETLFRITYKELSFELIMNQENGCTTKVKLIKTNPISSASIVGNNCTINDIGCEVAIGTEHFYVIGTDENNSNNVKLLAKYNLLVGSNIDPSSLEPTKTYTTSDTGYNLQSANAFGSQQSSMDIINTDKGIMATYTPTTKQSVLSNLTSAQIADIAYFTPSNNSVYTINAVTNFIDNCSGKDSEGYWSSGGYLSSRYGSSYPANVFNNRAAISTFVNAYSDILENTYDFTVLQARLIYFSELIDLGCSSYTSTGQSVADCAVGNIITNNRTWLFDTSYWTGTATNKNNVYGIDINGDVYGSYPSYDGEDRYGVRPVIVVAKSIFD